MIKSKKIRDSANGEECTLQMVGICNYDATTVVLAHLPDPDSNGMGTKPDDISAAYACGRCHDVIDGRDKRGRESLQPGELDWYMRRGQVRTLRRMVEKGVIRL